MNYIGVFLAMIVATSVLAVGGVGVAEAQTDTVTLTVTVVTPDGDTVSDADLTATWDDGSTTETTASNGKAFVDVPDGADVSIDVSHADFIRNYPYELDDASEEDVEVTVATKSNATISVADDSGSVDDARVVLEKDDREVFDDVTTEGTIETETIEAGTYTVTVSKAGYLTAERELEVENATEGTVTIERATITLSVNVTDDYFDPPRPVSGVTVDVAGAGSVITHSDGTQQLSVAVNTDHNVTVTKENYDTVERTIPVRESDRTAAIDVDRSPALSIETANERIVVGETVRITVTDEYDDPVADASVLLNGDVVASTDDDGDATIEIDAAGDQEIAVEKGGMSSAQTTVVGVTADGETTEPAEPTTEAPTTTATTEAPTTTTTSTGVMPDIPGQYVSMLIVALALLAVLLGFRWWNQQ